MEEMNMRRDHGEAYERYRQRAPFLFPVPGFVERLFAWPQRILFRKERFERSREVAVVLALYTVAIVGASAFFYGTGVDRLALALSPSRNLETALTELAQQIREEPESRPRYFLAGRLAEFGPAALPHLLTLLQDEDPGVRSSAAEQLATTPSPDAIPALVAALDDPDANVRGWSVRALWALGAPEARDGLARIVARDQEPWPRNDAIAALAAVDGEAALEPAMALLDEPQWWMRLDGVEALGLSGLDRALPALARAIEDESATVRQTAVIALLQIGSPATRPLLERAAEDEDWEVRLYAAEALERLQ